MLLSFWGKAGLSGDATKGHALAFHLQDVAAVAELLVLLFPAVARTFAEACGAEPDAIYRLIIRLAALHDIGKFAIGFQAKVPELYPPDLGALPDPVPIGDHTLIGFRLLTRELASDLDPLIEEFSAHDWKPLLMAVAAHHGRPLLDPDQHLRASDIGAASIKVARAWLGLTSCIIPGPPFRGRMSEEIASRLSLGLAGFINLADWIGSNTQIFHYATEGDPQTYWEDVARPRARRAIEAAGLTSSPINQRTGLTALTGMAIPSPLQAWAESVKLPDGPVLAMIEDMTGAGKTEAALILAHRLMIAGKGEGIYTAMPTMATANAMYDRLRHIYRKLFMETANPSLVLAHGAARFHDQFRASIIEVGGDETRYGPGGGDADETASTACAAWIADDRRKAFFAEIGAGTVDQAFLAVLPSKFAALRLLGLSRRILIIDEAHSYGAYEGEELARLIECHAGHGGSTIVLSATLPEIVKDRLTDGFLRGCNTLRGRGQARAWAQDYPAATLVDGSGGVAHFPLQTRPDRRGRLEVRRITPPQALKAIVETTQAGGCAAWIRNSVDDAIEACQRVRDAGLRPILFHARFAMADRLGIEKRVLEMFGRESRPEQRRGKVIVATQVIEQSLDLDFDLMVSDLAPIDLLLQRAGRVWRHAGRPRPMAGPQLLVVSPEPVDGADANWFRRDFPRAAAVYPNHALLWRSARVLFEKEIVEAPDDMRALVESVYGRGALDDAPAGLEGRRLSAEGKQRAEASLAQANLLTLADGYSSRAPWSPDIVTPTRLGEERTVLRLARWSAGLLTTWAGAEPPGGPLELARAWALSEVSVSARRVAGRGSCPPAIEAAAQAIEVHWREHGDRSVVLPMLPVAGTDFCRAVVRQKSGVEAEAFYEPGRGLAFAGGPLMRD